MKTAWKLDPIPYLLAMALVVAFVPWGGNPDAAAGDAPCCPPQDPCCPDRGPDGSDTTSEGQCCPSDCNVCLLICCATPASLLDQPVPLETGGGTGGAPTPYRISSASPDARAIYRPPRC